MPGRAFVDSNVLIYAVGDDEVRRGVSESLLTLRPVISTQVLAETASVLRRKFLLAPAEVTQVLQAVLAQVECEPLTAATVLAALGIADRLGYAHYDSQIIAAALAAGCAVLYSEDLHDSQVIDGTLAIVNPFKG